MKLNADGDRPVFVQDDGARIELRDGETAADLISRLRVVARAVEYAIEELCPQLDCDPDRLVGMPSGWVATKVEYSPLTANQYTKSGGAGSITIDRNPDNIWRTFAFNRLFDGKTAKECAWKIEEFISFRRPANLSFPAPPTPETPTAHD